jgi:membrane associated rhomboid family serine protease
VSLPLDASSRRMRPRWHPGAAAEAMVLIELLLFALQLVNSLTSDALLAAGIDPRTPSKLEDIFSAPFIHASWSHLVANSVPLFVIGFLVAIRGLRLFAAVSLIAAVTSGLGVFFIAASGSDTVGASGVIFGWFAYLLASGVIERRLGEIVVALVAGALYWSILPGVLPGRPGISWQGHLFGLLGGVLAALVLHRVAARRTANA